VNRIAGIDVARGLALLGMFFSHAAPSVEDGLGAFLLQVPDERSRLLFALTAGLGLGLLTGGLQPPGGEGGGERSVLRKQIAIRAACLLVLGLVFQATGVLVYVILDEYGIAFLIMLPFVFLPARWLLALGTALLAIAPGAAVALATRAAPAQQDRLWFLTDWFVTGAYPVFSWVAVLLLGVGLVRLGLGRREVVAGAGIAGLVAMVGGLGLSAALGGDGFEAPVEVARGSAGAEIVTAALGTSAFTIGNVGFCLVLTMLLVGCTSTVFGLPERVARGATAVTSPIGAAGSMPLTVYSAHLLVLIAAIHETPDGFLTDDGWPVVIGLVIGTLTLPWLWRRFIGRGPLETVIGLLSGRTQASPDNPFADQPTRR
jgi:uncharacterized membrane protein YeiB